MSGVPRSMFGLNSIWTMIVFEAVVDMMCTLITNFSWYRPMLILIHRHIIIVEINSIYYYGILGNVYIYIYNYTCVYIYIYVLHMYIYKYNYNYMKKENKHGVFQTIKNWFIRFHPADPVALPSLGAPVSVYFATWKVQAKYTRSCLGQ